MPVLFSLLLAGFALINLLMFPYGRDQGIYTMVARSMEAGGLPYRDAWDFKTPGIYAPYLLAHLVFGRAQWALRAVEALSLVSLYPAFVLISRWVLQDGRAGALAASLSIVFYAALGFWHTGQPEGFGGVLLAWALVFAGGPFYAGWRPPWLCSALCGACCSAAALMKPPLGGAILASAGFLLLAARTRPRSPVLGALVGLVAGGLAPVALTLLYFWWLGGLGDLAWTLFEFVPGYTKLRHETMTPWRLAALGAGVPLVRFGAAIPVGLALLALPPRCGRDGRVWLFYIGSVIGFQLVGAAIQAKLFAYHYAGVVLLCGLPVAWGHWKLRGVIGPSRARWVLPLALDRRPGTSTSPG
jgi:hypothetical protein